MIELLVDKLTDSGVVDKALLRSQLFENAYGLYDHLDDAKASSNPLAIIEVKEGESIVSNSQIKLLAERYAKAKVLARTGLTWYEYLRLPTSEATLLDTLCLTVIADAEILEKQRVAKHMDNELNNENKKR